MVEVIYPFEQEGIIWSDSINGLYTDKRDDQKYKVLKIGEQIWFAQNLNYYTNNGSWIYDWNKSNATKYGRLYDWNTAVNSCPEGWRIPTDADWKRIEKLYGLPPDELDDMQRFRGEYNSVANSFLKNGISGLNIVFGGHYDKSYKKSKFIDKEAKGPYWTSSSIGNKGVYRNFWKGSSGIWRNTENKMKGFSCRCIKDVNNK